MTLYAELQKAKSEQDVKMAYINALKLKSFNQTLIDIQTHEVWFEAKKNATSTYAMFTQLLHYVVQAKRKNERIPPLLCVIDSVKAALMRTSDVMPLLERTSIQWGKSASSFSQEALVEVSNFIGVHFVSFVIETHEEEFLTTMRDAIQTGQINRIAITPDNLRQVFDRWVDLIGKELREVKDTDYALLFFADIMNDGSKAVYNLPAEVYHTGNGPVFFFDDKRYSLKNQEGYRRFWAVYDRPPKQEHRKYLLERRDSLIPNFERMFKGAYYTPLNIVSEAYNYLDETLGKDWEKEYIIWDMCCGVGNLEAKHSHPRNIFMSTLDQPDIDIMKSSKICVGAERFQYDYLNDDIADDGSIDYSLSNKLPKALRDAIIESKKGNKKLLVLINPPYAESGNGVMSGEDNKKGVSDTKWASLGMQNLGKAKNELFAQFLTRVQIELPNAILAVFSKPKYITTEAFKAFQKSWIAEYKAGFVVHSKTFDGLKGDFPISFLIWKLGQGNTLQQGIGLDVDVLDRKGKYCGNKTFYPLCDNKLLNDWFDREKAQDTLCIPLKNAITPAEVTAKTKRWHKDAIGYMLCHGNDTFHGQQKTAIFSSTYGGGSGFFITSNNLAKASIVFGARRSTKHNWLNDKDQFYTPQEEPSFELENDCLIYMLFSNSNLTASAELDWDGQKWNLINHFIPFKEDMVGANDRFASHFMIDFLESRGELSDEAKDVMREGQKLWTAFFDMKDDFDTCEKLCLLSADVGWYQVRKALEMRNEKSHGVPNNFDAFGLAYKKLEDKIHPQFRQLGIIK